MTATAKPLKPGDICPKCSEPHNPTKCQAHSRSRSGKQCGLDKMTNQDVCHRHGGRSPGALAKAKRIERSKRLAFIAGQIVADPIDNPLTELQALAGRIRAWERLLEEYVDKIIQANQLRYGTDGGEAIRGEIQLYERAQERLHLVLASIARLNIDERLVAIQESKKEMILNAIEAALLAAHLTGPQILAARLAAAQHLRLAAALGEPTTILQPGQTIDAIDPHAITAA